MNVRDLISNVGDISLSEILLIQTANKYFQSKEFSLGKRPITIEYLKKKEPYFQNTSDTNIEISLRRLAKMGVFTESRHIGIHFAYTLKQIGSSSAATVKSDMSLPLEERRAIFWEKIWSVGNPKYSKEMLEKFFLYWSETNQKTSTMRFEDQDYFDEPRRLATWYGNNINRGNGGFNMQDGRNNR